MDIIHVEKKEIIPLTDYEKCEYEKRNYCYRCKKCFVMIKMIKVNMKYFAKSGIITTTPDNLEVLPTIFVEKQTRSKEKF